MSFLNTISYSCFFQRNVYIVKFLPNLLCGFHYGLPARAVILLFLKKTRSYYYTSRTEKMCTDFQLFSMSYIRKVNIPLILSALSCHRHNTSARLFKYDKTIFFVVFKTKTTCKKYQKKFQESFYIIHYDRIEVIFA